MQDDRSSSARWRRRIGHVAMLVALAVVPVLALNSLATADTGNGSGPRPRPGVTDALRQCLADHGVSVPRSGGDGTGLTAEQRRARRAAAADCGLGAPHDRLRVGALTDDQRQCLHDHGVDVAPGGAAGSGTSPSADWRATRRRAAEACGLPTRGAHAGGGAGQI